MTRPDFQEMVNDPNSFPPYRRQGGDISEIMVDDQSSLPSCGGDIIPLKQDAQQNKYNSLPCVIGYRGGSGWGVFSNRTGMLVSAAWVLVLTIIALEASMTMLGISIGINPTESQPYRLFLILKKRPFDRGDLVSFRFPGSEYYAEGSFFVKEVHGKPGDHLEIRKDRTVWLNGRFLDTVRATDSQGKAVKPFLFDGPIPEGHYFMYAPAQNSYDSRYYGLIGKERIVGKAIPLW